MEESTATVPKDVPLQPASTASAAQPYYGRPPPSPLSGGYLLIVISEPLTDAHKAVILQKLSKAFLSWNVEDSGIDIERELAIVTALSPEGDFAKNGERLIQNASEHLVTEILIHPQINTMRQCIRNLLSSFTKYRFIIHAGYVFCGNGSWILQDGTFSVSDFIDAFQEIEVQRVIRAYEKTVKIDICCIAEGGWTQSRLQQEPFSKLCQLEINPSDKIAPGIVAVREFVDYLEQYIIPSSIEHLLEPSDIVGNIRFTHPTLYVFPGGEGDAALFGINGFNMLVDGGFGKKACFWNFVRHLDRLDAVLMTRVNNSNIGGMSGVVERKVFSHVYPQVGHFFCNLQGRKQLPSPDGDKDREPLLVNLIEESDRMVLNLKQLQLKPHHCYRDATSDPINLYHKVGHGKLDMYVISPAKDSREVKEFLSRWNNHDIKLFSGTSKTGSRELRVPLQNLVSICALLVWQPANPDDKITRILFPGSTPQHKIFEGLERLKPLEFLKHSTCTVKSVIPAQTPLLSKPAAKKFVSKLDKQEKILDEFAKSEAQIKSSLAGNENETDSGPQSLPVDLLAPVSSAIKSATPKPKRTVRKLTEKAVMKDIKSKTDHIVKEKSSAIDGIASDKSTADSQSSSGGVTKESTLEKKKIERKPVQRPVVAPPLKPKASTPSNEDKKPIEFEKSSSPTTPKKSFAERKSAQVKSTVVTSQEKVTTPKDKDQTTEAITSNNTTSSSTTTFEKESAASITTLKEQSKVSSTTTTTSTAKPISRPAPRTRTPPKVFPAKSLKDENNRKVAESKPMRTAPTKIIATPKPIKKEEEQNVKVEKKQNVKRTKLPPAPSQTHAVPKPAPAKPSSPVKAVRKPISITSKKLTIGDDKKLKPDNEKTDSSAVSTPSTLEADTTLLKTKAKSESAKSTKDTTAKSTAVKKIRPKPKPTETQSTKTSIESESIKPTPLIGETTTHVSKIITQQGDDDDEILIIETTEMKSISKHDYEEQKHLRDQIESEKEQIEKDHDISKSKINQSLDLVQVNTTKQPQIDEKNAVTLTPEDKEKIFGEVQGIISTAAEMIATVKPSTNQKPATPVDKPESTQPQAKEPVHGSQETSSTTAPTMPEDEKIDFDEPKQQEEIEEKYDKEDTKEKSIENGQRSKIDAQIQLVEQKSEDVLFKTKKDIVKTPDEVADLPVHEEVDDPEYEETMKGSDHFVSGMTTEEPVIEVVKPEHPEYVTITPTSSPDEKPLPAIVSETVQKTKSPDGKAETFKKDSLTETKVFESIIHEAEIISKSSQDDTQTESNLVSDEFTTTDLHASKLKSTMDESSNSKLPQKDIDKDKVSLSDSEHASKETSPLTDKKPEELKICKHDEKHEKSGLQNADEPEVCTKTTPSQSTAESTHVDNKLDQSLQQESLLRTSEEVMKSSKTKRSSFTEDDKLANLSQKQSLKEFQEETLESSEIKSLSKDENKISDELSPNESLKVLPGEATNFLNTKQSSIAKDETLGQSSQKQPLKELQSFTYEDEANHELSQKKSLKEFLEETPKSTGMKQPSIVEDENLCQSSQKSSLKVFPKETSLRNESLNISQSESAESENELGLNVVSPSTTKSEVELNQLQNKETLKNESDETFDILPKKPCSPTENQICFDKSVPSQTELTKPSEKSNQLLEKESLKESSDLFKNKPSLSPTENLETTKRPTELTKLDVESCLSSRKESLKEFLDESSKLVLETSPEKSDQSQRKESLKETSKSLDKSSKTGDEKSLLEFQLSIDELKSTTELTPSLDETTKSARKQSVTFNDESLEIIPSEDLSNDQFTVCTNKLRKKSITDENFLDVDDDDDDQISPSPQSQSSEKDFQAKSQTISSEPQPISSKTTKTTSEKVLSQMEKSLLKDLEESCTEKPIMQHSVQLTKHDNNDILESSNISKEPNLSPKEAAPLEKFLSSCSDSITSSNDDNSTKLVTESTLTNIIKDSAFDAHEIVTMLDKKTSETTTSLKDTTSQSAEDELKSVGTLEELNNRNDTKQDDDIEKTTFCEQSTSKIGDGNSSLTEALQEPISLRDVTKIEDANKQERKMSITQEPLPLKDDITKIGDTSKQDRKISLTEALQDNISPKDAVIKQKDDDVIKNDDAAKQERKISLTEALQEPIQPKDNFSKIEDGNKENRKMSTTEALLEPISPKDDVMKNEDSHKQDRKISLTEALQEGTTLKADILKIEDANKEESNISPIEAPQETISGKDVTKNEDSIKQDRKISLTEALQEPISPKDDLSKNEDATTPERKISLTEALQKPMSPKDEVSKQMDITKIDDTTKQKRKISLTEALQEPISPKDDLSKKEDTTKPERKISLTEALQKPMSPKDEVSKQMDITKIDDTTKQERKISLTEALQEPISPKDDLSKNEDTTKPERKISLTEALQEPMSPRDEASKQKYVTKIDDTIKQERKISLTEAVQQPSSLRDDLSKSEDAYKKDRKISLIEDLNIPNSSKSDVTKTEDITKQERKVGRTEGLQEPIFANKQQRKISITEEPKEPLSLKDDITKTEDTSKQDSKIGLTESLQEHISPKDDVKKVEEDIKHERKISLAEALQEPISPKHDVKKIEEGIKHERKISLTEALQEPISPKDDAKKIEDDSKHERKISLAEALQEPISPREDVKRVEENIKHEKKISLAEALQEPISPKDDVKKIEEGIKHERKISLTEALQEPISPKDDVKKIEDDTKHERKISLTEALQEPISPRDDVKKVEEDIKHERKISLAEALQEPISPKDDVKKIEEGIKHERKISLTEALQEPISPKDDVKKIEDDTKHERKISLTEALQEPISPRDDVKKIEDDSKHERKISLAEALQEPISPRDDVKKIEEGMKHERKISLTEALQEPISPKDDVKKIEDDTKHERKISLTEALQEPILPRDDVKKVGEDIKHERKISLAEALQEPISPKDVKKIEEGIKHERKISLTEALQEPISPKDDVKKIEDDSKHERKISLTEAQKEPISPKDDVKKIEEDIKHERKISLTAAQQEPISPRDDVKKIEEGIKHERKISLTAAQQEPISPRDDVKKIEEGIKHERKISLAEALQEPISPKDDVKKIEEGIKHERKISLAEALQEPISPKDDVKKIEEGIKHERKISLTEALQEPISPKDDVKKVEEDIKHERKISLAEALQEPISPKHDVKKIEEGIKHERKISLTEALQEPISPKDDAKKIEDDSKHERKISLAEALQEPISPRDDVKRVEENIKHEKKISLAEALQEPISPKDDVKKIEEGIKHERKISLTEALQEPISPKDDVKKVEEDIKHERKISHAEALQEPISPKDDVKKIDEGIKHERKISLTEALQEPISPKDDAKKIEDNSKHERKISLAEALQEPISPKDDVKKIEDDTKHERKISLTEALQEPISPRDDAKKVEEDIKHERKISLAEALQKPISPKDDDKKVEECIRLERKISLTAAQQEPISPKDYVKKIEDDTKHDRKISLTEALQEPISPPRDDVKKVEEDIKHERKISLAEALQEPISPKDDVKKVEEDIKHERKISLTEALQEPISPKDDVKKIEDDTKHERKISLTVAPQEPISPKDDVKKIEDGIKHERKISLAEALQEPISPKDDAKKIEVGIKHERKISLTEALQEPILSKDDVKKVEYDTKHERKISLTEALQEPISSKGDDTRTDEVTRQDRKISLTEALQEPISSKDNATKIEDANKQERKISLTQTLQEPFPQKDDVTKTYDTSKKDKKICSTEALQDQLSPKNVVKIDDSPKDDVTKGGDWNKQERKISLTVAQQEDVQLEEDITKNDDATKHQRKISLTEGVKEHIPSLDTVTKQKDSTKIDDAINLTEALQEPILQNIDIKSIEDTTKQERKIGLTEALQDSISPKDDLSRIEDASKQDEKINLTEALQKPIPSKDSVIKQKDDVTKIDDTIEQDEEIDLTEAIHEPILRKDDLSKKEGTTKPERKISLTEAQQEPISLKDEASKQKYVTKIDDTTKQERKISLTEAVQEPFPLQDELSNSEDAIKQDGKISLTEALREDISPKDDLAKIEDATKQDRKISLTEALQSPILPQGEVTKIEDSRKISLTEALQNEASLKDDATIIENVTMLDSGKSTLTKSPEQSTREDSLTQIPDRKTSRSNTIESVPFKTLSDTKDIITHDTEESSQIKTPEKGFRKESFSAIDQKLDLDDETVTQQESKKMELKQIKESISTEQDIMIHSMEKLDSIKVTTKPISTTQSTEKQDEQPRCGTKSKSLDHSSVEPISLEDPTDEQLPDHKCSLGLEMVSSSSESIPDSQDTSRTQSFSSNKELIASKPKIDMKSSPDSEKIDQPSISSPSLESSLSFDQRTIEEACKTDRSPLDKSLSISDATDARKSSMDTFAWETSPIKIADPKHIDKSDTKEDISITPSEVLTSETTSFTILQPPTSKPTKEKLIDESPSEAVSKSAISESITKTFPTTLDNIEIKQQKETSDMVSNVEPDDSIKVEFRKQSITSDVPEIDSRKSSIPSELRKSSTTIDAIHQSESSLKDFSVNRKDSLITSLTQEQLGEVSESIDSISQIHKKTSLLQNQSITETEPVSGSITRKESLEISPECPAQRDSFESQISLEVSVTDNVDSSNKIIPKTTKDISTSLSSDISSKQDDEIPSAKEPLESKRASIVNESISKLETLAESRKDSFTQKSSDSGKSSPGLEKSSIEDSNNVLASSYKKSLSPENNTTYQSEEEPVILASNKKSASPKADTKQKKSEEADIKPSNFSTQSQTMSVEVDTKPDTSDKIDRIGKEHVRASIDDISSITQDSLEPSAPKQIPSKQPETAIQSPNKSSSLSDDIKSQRSTPTSTTPKETADKVSSTSQSSLETSSPKETLPKKLDTDGHSRKESMVLDSKRNSYIFQSGASTESIAGSIDDDFDSKLLPQGSLDIPTSKLYQTSPTTSTGFEKCESITSEAREDSLGDVSSTTKVITESTFVSSSTKSEDEPKLVLKQSSIVSDSQRSSIAYEFEKDSVDFHHTSVSSSSEKISPETKPHLEDDKTTSQNVSSLEDFTTLSDKQQETADITDLRKSSITVDSRQSSLQVDQEDISLITTSINQCIDSRKHSFVEDSRESSLQLDQCETYITQASPKEDIESCKSSIQLDKLTDSLQPSLQLNQHTISHITESLTEISSKEALQPHKCSLADSKRESLSTQTIEENQKDFISLQKSSISDSVLNQRKTSVTDNFKEESATTDFRKASLDLDFRQVTSTTVDTFSENESEVISATDNIPSRKMSLSSNFEKKIESGKIEKSTEDSSYKNHDDSEAVSSRVTSTITKTTPLAKPEESKTTDIISNKDASEMETSPSQQSRITDSRERGIAYSRTGSIVTSSGEILDSEKSSIDIPIGSFTIESTTTSTTSEISALENKEISSSKHSSITETTTATAADSSKSSSNWSESQTSPSSKAPKNIVDFSINTTSEFVTQSKTFTSGADTTSSTESSSQSKNIVESSSAINKLSTDEGPLKDQVSTKTITIETIKDEKLDEITSTDASSKVSSVTTIEKEIKSEIMYSADNTQTTFYETVSTSEQTKQSSPSGTPLIDNKTSPSKKTIDDDSAPVSTTPSSNQQMIDHESKIADTLTKQTTDELEKTINTYQSGAKTSHIISSDSASTELHQLEKLSSHQLGSVSTLETCDIDLSHRSPSPDFHSHKSATYTFTKISSPDSSGSFTETTPRQDLGYVKPFDISQSDLKSSITTEKSIDLQDDNDSTTTTTKTTTYEQVTSDSKTSTTATSTTQVISSQSPLKTTAEEHPSTDTTRTTHVETVTEIDPSSVDLAQFTSVSSADLPHPGANFADGSYSTIEYQTITKYVVIPSADGSPSRIKKYTTEIIPTSVREMSRAEYEKLHDVSATSDFPQQTSITSKPALHEMDSQAHDSFTQFHPTSTTSTTVKHDPVTKSISEPKILTSPDSGALHMDANQMRVQFLADSSASGAASAIRKSTTGAVISKSSSDETYDATVSDTLSDLSSSKFHKKEVVSKTVSLPILDEVAKPRGGSMSQTDSSEDISRSLTCLEKIAYTEGTKQTISSDPSSLNKQPGESELQLKSASLPVIKRPNDSEKYMTLPNLYKTTNLEDLTAEDIIIEEKAFSSETLSSVKPNSTSGQIAPIKETDEQTDDDNQPTLIKKVIETTTKITSHLVGALQPDSSSPQRSQTPCSEDRESDDNRSDISLEQCSRITQHSGGAGRDSSQICESDEDDEFVESMSTPCNMPHFKEEDSIQHQITSLQEETMRTMSSSMTQSFYGTYPEDDDDELPEDSRGSSMSTSVYHTTQDPPKDDKKDPIKDWGRPLGLPNVKNIDKLLIWNPIEEWGRPLSLPTPAPPPPSVQDRESNGDIEINLAPINPSTNNVTKSTPTKKVPKKPTTAEKMNTARETSKTRDSSIKRTKPTKPTSPIYVDLAYVPHHGNPYYTTVEFFKRIRARYYVFSGTDPSKEVFNALIDAKKTWEDQNLEVTIIPTYDTDVLGYWITENEETLLNLKIDLSPSASRCTINLQDHDTSCSAYRLEF